MITEIKQFGNLGKIAKFLLAEEEGFEPSNPFGLPVFKTGGINRYPTPP